MYQHSFTVTVYQESPYLERCIKSLIEQTVKSNIIMATSTPTAFSKNIAEKYGVDYRVNEIDDKGATTNWNFAFNQPTTKLITIVHQDDVYEPDYAEVVIENMDKYADKNVLIAFTNYTDLIDTTIRKYSLSYFVKISLLWPFYFSKAIRSEFFKRLVLLFGNPICCPSVTFNMDNVKNFSFSYDHSTTIDWFAWYQLSQQPGAFLYINKRLISRRLHQGSGTSLLLSTGITSVEERKFFELMWGSKLIAKIIARIYAIGHKDNVV